MRGLVIDYVRRSRAQKRGGGAFQLTFVEEQVPAAGASGFAGYGRGATALERLSDALDELAAVEPGLAQLVDLHFFCGFSFLEIASLRGVSDRTVRRDWRKARLFLHDVLQDAGGEG
jgi:DNA-directed RNA polymerase specialized sigma24 family protein